MIKSERIVLFDTNECHIHMKQHTTLHIYRENREMGRLL